MDQFSPDYLKVALQMLSHYVQAKTDANASYASIRSMKKMPRPSSKTGMGILFSNRKLGGRWRKHSVDRNLWTASTTMHRIVWQYSSQTSERVK
jgi:hypothetical protein